MRGKKSNNEFVSGFIVKCCESNIFTPDDIIKEAEKEISIIDEQLRKLNELKKRKSGLLDVLNMFEKKENLDLQVKFHSISNRIIAKQICENLPYTGTHACVHELLSIKVLNKSNGKIIAGENYNQFKDFLKNG